jgi:hypothetical protein
MNIVIKIMPEYECYPIWISENGGIFENINPRELKISEILKNQIENWDSKFEKTYNKKNPINSGFNNKSQEIAFEKEGVIIQENLVKELNDYNVIYVPTFNSSKSPNF